MVVEALTRGIRPLYPYNFQMGIRRKELEESESEIKENLIWLSRKHDRLNTPRGRKIKDLLDLRQELQTKELLEKAREYNEWEEGLIRHQNNFEIEDNPHKLAVRDVVFTRNPAVHNGLDCVKYRTYVIDIGGINRSVTLRHIVCKTKLTSSSTEITLPNTDGFFGMQAETIYNGKAEEPNKRVLEAALTTSLIKRYGFRI